MSAYDPNFETDLSSDLFQTEDPAAAFRAMVAIPVTMRMNGLRILAFSSSCHLSVDEAMRDAAVEGLERALNSYATASAFLLNWKDDGRLNADVAEVFSSLLPTKSEALDVIEAFHEKGARILAIAQAGRAIEVALLNDLMMHAYQQIHPTMVSLSKAFAEEGAVLRHRLVQRAKGARATAQKTCGEIEAISRIVRMLSINARIEAANAGEAGRGFAVLSSEISSLADKTDDAGRRIIGMIDEIMENVRVV